MTAELDFRGCKDQKSAKMRFEPRFIRIYHFSYSFIYFILFYIISGNYYMTTSLPHLYHVVHLSYRPATHRGEPAEASAVDATGDDGTEQRFRLLRSVGEECATSLHVESGWNPGGSWQKLDEIRIRSFFGFGFRISDFSIL